MTYNQLWVLKQIFYMPTAIGLNAWLAISRHWHGGPLGIDFMAMSAVVYWIISIGSYLVYRRMMRYGL